MLIVINPGAELSIYRQIMRQIVEAIASGQLEAGAKLPSHRELSEQIVVAPLTVKKAYDELEALGYIETQRGRGTFVSEKLPKVNKTDNLDKIEEAARQLLSLAYLGGYRLPDILKILKDLDRELANAAVRSKEKV
jgi:GntR family transcriptional regulator